MFIGRKQNSKSSYYDSYIDEQAEHTIRIGKFLIAFGVPSLVYFLYQDFYIAKIPLLFYARLIFIIPFISYIIFIFFFKNKEPKHVEMLHSVLLFSLMLMCISMLIVVINYEQGIGFHSKQVLNALIVNTFVIFVFAGVSLRWLHLIIGIHVLILIISVFMNSFGNLNESMILLSNYVFIAAILTFRSFQLEHARFREFMTRVKFEEEYNSNIEITNNLEKSLIENKRLNEELKNYALHDELTGTYPRNVGLNTLEIELEKAKRKKYLVTLGFIDLDGLKYVNDTFGHSEGDAFIVAIIGKLKMRIRSSDYIIRIGGDEFLLVLPECDYEKADEILKSVQKSLVEVKKPYKCQYSYGISTQELGCDRNIDELIKEADERMYKDKFSKNDN